MKNVKNVMIDIETLGTTPDACILQVGAVWWDNQVIHDGISFNLSVSEQTKLGRKIDPQTVGWWMDDKVSSNVRKSVLERSDTVSLEDGLRCLNDYIRPTDNDSLDEVVVWANPPQFDISIIRSAMEQVGIIPSWKHWQERDLRTLRNICKQLGIKFEEKNKEHHSALSDARHQVTEVINLLEVLEVRTQQVGNVYTPSTSSLG